MVCFLTEPLPKSKNLKSYAHVIAPCYQDIDDVYVHIQILKALNSHMKLNIFQLKHQKSLVCLDLLALQIISDYV